MVQKPRGGQSHQQMAGGKKGSNGASGSTVIGSGQTKRFKANPQILSSEAHQDGTVLPQQEQQFMGKRNNQGGQQATAPAGQGARKKQSNTINVDELAGAA